MINMNTCWLQRDPFSLGHVVVSHFWNVFFLAEVMCWFVWISERLLRLSTSFRDNVLVLLSGQKVFGDSFALFQFG